MKKINYTLILHSFIVLTIGNLVYCTIFSMLYSSPLPSKSSPYPKGGKRKKCTLAKTHTSAHKGRERLALMDEETHGLQSQRVYHHTLAVYITFDEMNIS